MNYSHHKKNLTFGVPGYKKGSFIRCQVLKWGNLREAIRRTSSSYQCNGVLTFFTLCVCILASCVLNKQWDGEICSVLLPIWGKTAHMIFYYRLIIKTMSCTFFLLCVFALLSWSAAHLLMTCQSKVRKLAYSYNYYHQHGLFSITLNKQLSS